MPVLGCGAEMSRLMEVADQDVAAIEEVIQERLDMGVSQAVAQRQAVDEVLAQLGEERSMVMKAIQEQLGFSPEAANEKNSAFTFSDEFVGAYSGQTNHVLTARGPDGESGTLEYTVYRGEPSISMVDVPASQRRKGVGTALVRELQRAFPNEEIRWGLMTDDGASLRASLQFDRVETAAAPLLRELDGVRAEMAALERMADTGTKLTVQQVDRWNELRDREYDLTSEIGGDRGYKEIVRQVADTIAGGTQAPVMSNKSQTDTPEFKRWFGDSKVVDAEGKPLVVYHGTRSEFSVFESGKAEGLGGRGERFFYFTPEEWAAESISENIDGPGKPRVVAAYLSLQNPITIDMKGRDGSVYSRLLKAENAGHDGAIIKNWNDGTHPDDDEEIPNQYVAFKNTQIKSATGNDGQFDPENPDIRFSNKPYYSALARAIDALPAKALPAGAWEPEDGEGDGSRAPVEQLTQPGFDVTDQMRAVAGEGLPLFANKAKGNKSEGRFIDRDAAGRWRFAIARQSADFLARMGGRKILDKLYLTMPSGPVREQLRQMKLDNQRGLDTAMEIAEQVNAIPLAERELVSDVIEQEVKAGIIPPQHVIETAALMNDAIGKQTDKLVELGMLSQEAADRWRGKYLPRYYEPRLKDTVAQTWADVVGKFRNYPAAEMGIKGRSLKGRGTYLTIPTSDLAKFEALGWEIRDKSYDKATSQEVRVWRDYTREEREKMGEIRDAGFRFVLGYMQTQRDIALGTMYKRLAADPDFSSANEKDGWVRVPDTKVPDTDAYRYGKLAGRYVPADLMMQLQTEREMESEALRTYKKALSWWKSNKTVMNPVGHMNNFVSNITMAHFGGVSYWDAHKYAAAVKDFATGAQSIKDARDAGLFLGDMTDTDLHRLLPPELKALLDKIDPAAMKALRVADTLLTFGLRGKMTQAYEFGDKFFKYVLWKDAKDRGATDSEAVEHAQKYIFNYDDLPLGARRIRDFGLPFFAYTYKAIPALVDTAASRPDRFFLPAGLITLANAMAYAVAAAGDDDDWLKAAKRYITDPEYRKKAKEMEEEERKKLPEWMKGRTSLLTQKNIRMGTDKLTDLPVFLDISRFIPGGDLLDMDSNVSGAFPMLQVLTPNNPLLSIYSGMVLNKDAYFGKDIVNPKTDDSGESTAKRADFLWKLATPAIAVGGTMWEKAINLAAHYNGGELPIPDAVGGSLTGVGKDGVPIQPKYGIPSLVGVKARPMDLEMSESIDKSNKRKTLAELDAQLRQARRMNSKGAMSDRVYDRTVEKIQTKKERIREGLTIDGNEKD